MTFEIYQDLHGFWRWRTTRKGRITADSGEGYANKANARRAAKAHWSAAQSSHFVVEGD